MLACEFHQKDSLVNLENSKKFTLQTLQLRMTEARWYIGMPFA